MSKQSRSDQNECPIFQVGGIHTLAGEIAKGGENVPALAAKIQERAMALFSQALAAGNQTDFFALPEDLQAEIAELIKSRAPEAVAA